MTWWRRRNPLPGFYSSLERAIQQKMPNRASPEQVRGIVKGAGVTQDELRWTGFDGWLGTQGKSITKDETMAFLRDNRVNVEEVVKGGGGLHQFGTPAEQAAATARRERATEHLRQTATNVDDPAYLAATAEYQASHAAMRDIVPGWGRAAGEQAVPTRHERWQVPGAFGGSYRELLLTWPGTPRDIATNAARKQVFEEFKQAQVQFGPDSTQAAEVRARLQAMPAPVAAKYPSHHWEEPNVLAHMRFNERRGADGKRVMFVEEIQSDWHQMGREKGYLGGEPRIPEQLVTPVSMFGQDTMWRIGNELTKPGANTEALVIKWDPSRRHISETGTQFKAEFQADVKLFDSFDDAVAWAKERQARILPSLAMQAQAGVPPAPFAKTWPSLALKRALRYAAENGYDRLAWTTGKQQADRYELAKYIKRIGYTKRADGLYNIQATDKKNEEIVVEGAIPLSRVEELVGKEMAAKMQAETAIYDSYQGDKTGELKGLNLQIGGEGMQGFYDQMLPEAANKLAKRFGARVGTSEISISASNRKQATVHSLDITPELRKAALEEGFALFNPLRAVASALYANPLPGFYSSLERAIQQKMPNRASPEQVRGIVKGSGITQDELRWTGFEQWLGEQGKAITKDEAMAFLRDNRVNVEEVVKGGGPPHRFGTPEEQAAAIERVVAAQARLSAFPIRYQMDDPPYRAAVEEYRVSQEAMRDIVPGWGRPPGDTVIPTKHATFQLPGGENYRELLITLPERYIYPKIPSLTRAEFDEMGRLGARMRREGNLPAPEMTRWRELHDRGVQYEHEARALHEAGKNQPPYRHPHWDEPNVLAHMRFNERLGADGKKVMFIEEIQSDWHQTGRKQGYWSQSGKAWEAALGKEASRHFGVEVTPNEAIELLTRSANEEKAREIWGDRLEALRSERSVIVSGVPAAPFAKTWPELTLKRALRYASEHDFDRIAWTTGTQQVARWSSSMRQVADELRWTPENIGNKGILTVTKGDQIVREMPLFAEDLPATVGKEVAAKLTSTDTIIGSWQNRVVHKVAGGDLTVGGEGMKGFYDTILPEAANKLGKRFGARVGEERIAATNDPRVTKSSDMVAVHSLDITPALRKAVLEEGFALFNPLGAVASGVYANPRYYHGTGHPFEAPDPSKFDPRALFGPGYYMTDSPEVASSYAKARSDPSRIAPSEAVAERHKTAWDGIVDRLRKNQRQLDIARIDEDKKRVEGLERARAVDEYRLDQLHHQMTEETVYEAQIAANVRPITVPMGLKLLNADAPRPNREIIRFTEQLAQALGDAHLRDLAKRMPAGFESGEFGPSFRTFGDILQEQNRSPEVMAATNKALAAMGYDGIKYEGGKRTGGKIEHQALVVFPESLHKIENALSRTKMGNPVMYHGTQSYYERPDPKQFFSEGLWGPAYYLTNEPRIADEYAMKEYWPPETWEEPLERYKLTMSKATPGTPEWDAASSAVAYWQKINDRAAKVGPNVRVIKTPPFKLRAAPAPSKYLHLLDADHQIPPGEAERIMGLAVSHFGERYRESRVSHFRPGEAVTGEQLYKQLKATTEDSLHRYGDPRNKIEVNAILGEAGYDGVKYAGGKRMPVKDVGGKPIKHDAVAVFPGSLDKIENAISRTKMGNPRKGAKMRRNPDINWAPLALVGGGALLLYLLLRPRGSYSPPGTGILPSGSQTAVDKAVAMLRQELPGANINLISVDAATWYDSMLGCGPLQYAGPEQGYPVPGGAPLAGWRILLGADRTSFALGVPSMPAQYEFHSDLSGSQVVYCNPLIK